MQKQQDWYDEIQPLSPEEDAMRTERILERVTKQLPQTAESEKITMKKSVLTRRIRPLIFAAAAVAVGAVSMIAANAATDGAVVARLTAYINGEPYEVEGRVIQEDSDGNAIAYEFEICDDEEDGEEHDFRVVCDEDGLERLEEQAAQKGAELETDTPADSAAE